MVREKTVGLKKTAHAPRSSTAVAPAPTSSAKPVAKKQQKQKQAKLMIDSELQKQEKAEPRKRQKKEEAHDEEEEDDEEDDEEERVPRKSSHMGGMRGLMMRGGAEGSSSSDSGGSDDDEDEMDPDGDAPQKGSKKRLLSTAAADAASKKQASATLKSAATKGVVTSTIRTGTTTSSSSSISSSAAATASAVKYDGSYKNRQRVLVFCSRGVTARYRHLLEDLRKLIPHHKKDVKLDCKGDLQVVNEIAEVKSCNNSLFLEARKRQDLYLWLSKTPLGPSIKFNVLNVHTLDELRLTGNAMLGSRPLLSFDLAFDAQPHTRLIKALLTDTFGTPRGHPKSKPFVDRVLSFALADGKVWVRNYQIVDTAPEGTSADPLATDKAEAKAAARAAAAAKKKDKGGSGVEGGNEDELTSLVEIGPRFVLNPIRIFSGSFGGPTLYQNPSFISPNFVRSEKKRTEGTRLAHKMKADSVRKERKAKAVLPKDELQELFRVKV
eukprot:evm.model.NODE_24622_length_62854_cov_30.334282.2